jgi:hypothetical protein
VAPEQQNNSARCPRPCGNSPQESLTWSNLKENRLRKLRKELCHSWLIAQFVVKESSLLQTEVSVYLW